MKRTALILMIIFAVTANAKEGEMLISARGTMKMPMGEFSDYGFETGYGANGSFDYMFDKDLSANFTIGYTAWPATTKDELIEGMKQGHDLYDIPLSVGVRYYLDRIHSFCPYVGMEFGFHFLNYKYEMNYLNTQTSTYTTIAESESYTKFGLAPIIGVLFPLNKNVSVNANVKFTWVSFESQRPEGYTQLGNLTMFSLNAGVSYFLK